MMIRCALFLVVSIALSACGEARGGDPANAADPARQIIVALDLSGSQTAARRAQARSTLGMVIDNLQYGDRLVLLQVHQNAAAEDGAQRWNETVPVPDGEPTTLDRERLDAVKQAARSVGETLFARDSAGMLPTTDLFSTLHIAGEYVRDGGPRSTTIVLLSDMLQSAHAVEMSQAVPDASWIEQQRASGVLPRLDGACVTVIGADATTANGVAVREFWQKYFASAGASLPEQNYRLISTDSSLPACN
jgi:hypothetical protein